ncbi:unnamed protein product [Prunus armeniaca]|uniref:Uncharacterized protein n=1 Tax=Prunus armeniaca TaxID=36596 RepID=A0A6J5XLN3_PRUAR|nr:unnamed protein product [Prunus armeniaca]CAB4312932.1 unnamed protein product [Prunus armeniaca]
MKRARDIRDQLEELLERVEIELVSNLSDYETIKKASSLILQSFKRIDLIEQSNIHRPSIYIPSSGLSQVKMKGQTTLNPPTYRVIYEFIPDFWDIYEYILNVAENLQFAPLPPCPLRWAVCVRNDGEKGLRGKQEEEAVDEDRDLALGSIQRQRGQWR